MIKFLLAILFLLCLLQMPYGYYQFVRFVALVGFAFLSLEAHKKGNETEKFIYGALAVLFQPFFKIALGRTLWNMIDIIVAAGLIISLFIKSNKEAIEVKQ